MYRIIGGSTQGLPDIEAFIETLNRLDKNPTAEARGLFDADADVIVTRAPGRLDVMGGIADYSGSMVLQLPIREAALVALQSDPTRVIRIVSLGAETNGRAAAFAMPLEDFEDANGPVDYATTRAYFARDPARRWAAYVAGAVLVLMRERGMRFDHGLRILIASHVPEGKGVSSSAAIEVAVMQAVTAGLGLAVDPSELAILCQKVENLVVGAPCGVMDQMTAACGQSNRLLSLLCRPAEIQGMLPIPEEIAIWGLDSGVHHSISGADYTSVRIGAFMGRRIIAELEGKPRVGGSPGEPVKLNNNIKREYLAEVTPSEFEQFYRKCLPEYLSGQEFLERYGGTGDSVTVVQPGLRYLVRGPATHPIYEHFRVRAAAELLGAPRSETRLELLGELMYQSHASYSACELSSEGPDLLVQLTRIAGPSQGLYGARITGGGSGGTVAVLGRQGADATIAAIAQQYARQTGHRPYIFSGSSPGAVAFGHLRLRNVAS